MSSSCAKLMAGNMAITIHNIVLAFMSLYFYMVYLMQIYHLFISWQGGNPHFLGENPSYYTFFT